MGADSADAMFQLFPKQNTLNPVKLDESKSSDNPPCMSIFNFFRDDDPWDERHNDG